MSEKTLYRRREWLNQDAEGDAFVSGSISHEENGLWNNFSAELSVMDCSRKATLSFNMYDKAEIENALTKVDLLAEVVIAFRQALHKTAKKAVKAVEARAKENAGA